MTLDDDQLHGLIRSLYDAALEPTQWPGLLERLRTALDTEQHDEIVRRVRQGEPNRGRGPSRSGQPHATGGVGDKPGRQGLDRLLPHVGKCMEIRFRLDQAESRSAGLAAALDRLPVAVLLVGADGRLVHANGAAQRLLGNEDGLTLRDGRLVAASRPETDRLNRLIRAAADTDARQVPIRLALHRPSLGQPLCVLMAPLPATPPLAGEVGAAVVLLAREPGGVAPVAGTHLIELYGLTSAEARVATALLAADGPREVAVRLGISVSTVRSHLHRLFDKTGTRRQAELIWLLGTLALL